MMNMSLNSIFAAIADVVENSFRSIAFLMSSLFGAVIILTAYFPHINSAYCHICFGIMTVIWMAIMIAWAVSNKNRQA